MPFGDPPSTLPPQLVQAQERLDADEQRRLNRPDHRLNLDEAKRLNRITGEDAGPAVAADRAEKLYTAIVPQLPKGFDFLAGRISLTVEEAAPAMGMGVRTLRAAIAKGEIPSVKIGGKRLIPLRALERHLEALAYTESGALDMWETSLAKAASTRLQRSKRDAFNARKNLRERMKEARRRAAELQASPGAARDVAVTVVAELAAARAQLTIEEGLASKVGTDLLGDIESLTREFGLDVDA